MALPAEWGTRTVERTYIEAGTGNPLSGTVSFLANIPVENMAESIVILPKKITGTLDGAGKLSIVLPVTDDTDMRNYNFTYKVTEALTYAGGGAYEDSYNIYVPTGGGVLQLGAQAPVPSSAGVVVVGGTAGKSAYQVAVDNGFVGNEAAWLASLIGEDGPVSSTPGPAGPSAYATWLAAGNVGNEAAFLLSLKGAPGDTSGLATVAGSGLATDLNTTGWNYAMLVAERQTQAILAAKVMVACDYNPLTSSFDATPDSRLRVCFFSDAAHDPGSAAKERDVWFVEAS